MFLIIYAKGGDPERAGVEGGDTLFAIRVSA